MVFPEPLIPANRITNGDFTSRDSLIVFIKSGGLISRDSIASFNSFARSISFRVLPINFSANEFLIDWTAAYATLFWIRIVSNSSNISSNFSSVSFFLKLPKNPFSSIGVLIVFFSDSFNSSFVGVIFFFSFLIAFFFFIGFSITSFSSFLLTHLLSFSFSLSNMFNQGVGRFYVFCRELFGEGEGSFGELRFSYLVGVLRNPSVARGLSSSCGFE